MALVHCLEYVTDEEIEGRNMVRAGGVHCILFVVLLVHASHALIAAPTSPESLPMKSEWTHVESAKQVEELSEVNTHVRADFLPASALGLLKKCPWITHLDLRNRWSVDWDGTPVENSDALEQMESRKGYRTEDMQGLVELANLQYLNVAYNVTLDNEFVVMVGKLKRLRTLILDGCETINVNALATVIEQDMLELTHLSLAYCRLFSDNLLRAIETSKIETLSLCGNPMASSCSWSMLSPELPLTEMDLSETSMRHQDLQAILKLPRMRALALSRVEKLSGVFNLGQGGGASKLNRLTMLGTELKSSDLKDIATHLPELEELELCNSRLIGELAGAPGIAQMKALKKLGLHGVLEVDTAFVNELLALKELERLDVSKTDVGDAIFVKLLDFRNLRTLDVSDCKGISEKAVGAFRDERPKIVVLTSSSRDETANSAK